MSLLKGIIMESRYIDADILIVGGGSAGCLAANRALEINQDLRVVIFEKGDIKYSGSIARGMDALNIIAIPNYTSPDLYVESVTMTCQGILDASPSYEMAKRSFDLLKKLESWGVYFPTDKSGNYQVLQYHPKGKFQVTMDEPDLKLIVSKIALDKGAVPINRVMGINLLMDGPRVAGAVGLNVRTGELVVCHADAVILASGGTARFTLPNSGDLYGTFDFPGNTGDGLIMAFQAGASLTGMECARRMMVIKDVSIPLLAITVNRGAQVLDIYDEVLMQHTCYTQEPMNRAFEEGRGPLRIRLRHLPTETIEEIEHYLFTTERPVQERFFKGRGIDFRKNDIELWPTEYQLCGGHGQAGIVVNERAESSVTGLYAAGDTACVAKGHLTGAFVYGEIAAENAVKLIESEPRTQLDNQQVRDITLQRNHRLDSVGHSIDVRQFEYKVRRLIGDYVISPKNEYKLQRWIEWAERFKLELDSDILIKNGHELSKLYEVENLILCATMAAYASLERKESRWAKSIHFRTDYPDRDDENWLCHLDVEKGDDPGTINITKRPISSE